MHCQLLIEEQLSDSRDWLFDTEGPSLADITVHFILSWAKSLPAGQSILDEQRHPKTLLVGDAITDSCYHLLNLASFAVAGAYNDIYQR